MNPTDAAVVALQEANRAIFVQSFKAAEGLAGIREALSTAMTSTGLIERHNFLGSVPKMRQTTYRPVELEELNRFSFTVENAEWTAGIEIHRLAIEADQLSYLKPRAAQLGREPVRHQTELILSNMASPGTAFDGLSFFNDAHVIGAAATIDNKLSVDIATPAAPTAAEVQTAVSQAKQIMRLFQDDKGRPMNLFPDTWVVPAHFETAFWHALNGWLAPGVTAPVPAPSADGVIRANGFTLIVNPYLSTSAHVFYGFHTRDEVKPFILQTLAAPEMGQTSPDGDLWKLENKLVQVVRGVYNYGITDPRYAIEVTFT